METRNSTIFNETLGENVTTEITVPAVLPTELRKNSDYSFGYVLITNSVALGFIPMVGLVVLNSLIFRTINQATQRHNAISSNQRRDHSVAMMLISVVVVFVICHSIRSVTNTYEFIQIAKYGSIKYWPSWIQTLVFLNHLALVVNSSINILIYTVKDEKFRNVMLKTLGLDRFIKNNNLSRAASNTQMTNVGNNSTSKHKPNKDKHNTMSNGGKAHSLPPPSTGPEKFQPDTATHLQTVVISNNSSSNVEATVTTALLASDVTNPGIDRLKISDSQTHKVTVDIINDKPESRVLKSDQNSVNCDDCCRSCSCGQSLTDSSDPDHDQSKSENGECFKENMSSSHLGPSLSNENSIGNTTSTSREKITKSSTGTQTVRL